MLPLFLSLDRVVRLHSSLIEAYGGSPGLRDAGVLFGSERRAWHVDLMKADLHSDAHCVSWLT